MVTVTFHGDLGKQLNPIWNLNVNSVSEAFRAIEMNTKKFRKYLMDKEKEHIKYQVLVNGEEVDGRNMDPDNIKNSAFFLRNSNLKTIDVIPILEGATGWIVAIVVAIIIAVVVYFITPQPNFGDFRQIDQGGKTSYLFSGPENVVGEGGPVPMGYGRLIIGSQVISAAYVILDFDTETGEVVRDEYGNLLPTFANVTDTRTNQGHGPSQTTVNAARTAANNMVGSTNNRFHGHN